MSIYVINLLVMVLEYQNIQPQNMAYNPPLCIIANKLISFSILHLPLFIMEYVLKMYFFQQILLLLLKMLFFFILQMSYQLIHLYLMYLFFINVPLLHVLFVNIHSLINHKDAFHLLLTISKLNNLIEFLKQFHVQNYKIHFIIFSQHYENFHDHQKQLLFIKVQLVNSFYEDSIQVQHSYK